MRTMEGNPELASDHGRDPLECPEIGRETVVESSFAEQLEQGLALFGGERPGTPRSLAMPQSPQPALFVGQPPFVNGLARHPQLLSDLGLRSSSLEQGDTRTSSHFQGSEVSANHKSLHALLYHTPCLLSSYL